VTESAIKNPSVTPEPYTREFFVCAGKRGGGRPPLPPGEKTKRAIERLERKLAELRAALPCRTSRRKAAR
jgi:hypothetical protein